MMAYLASPYGAAGRIGALAVTLAIFPIPASLGGLVGAVAFNVGVQIEKATNYVFQPIEATPA
jgi:hypothetical protein